MSAKLHVFIDTNVFLNFFAYTNDDIEELNKLVALVNTQKVKLYLTQHVSREFHRNRESKILQALAEFSASKTPGLPRLLAHYADANAYKQAVKNLKQSQDALSEAAKADALSQSLPADKLFAQIALAAGLLIEGEEELAKGRTRTELGDPPGKLNSMGDRLNWEMLLKNATPKVDLHIVSKDGDFASSIDAKQAHPVLTSEWETKNGGKLILYSDLRSFFAKHFPEIELATDVEKKEAIDRLRLSGNFARTHLAISKLEPFMSLLSAAELDELMEAGLNNEQIRWIGTDADVSNFFCEVAKKRWETYPPEKQQDILAVFGLQLVEPAKA